MTQPSGDPGLDRLVDVASTLFRRTVDGTIAWTTTEKGDRFLYTGTNTSVWIEGRIDRDGDWTGVLTILDSNGNVADTLQTEFPQVPQLIPVLSSPSTYRDAPWNKILRRLHDAARRKALDVDAVIDSLMGDLAEPPSS